MLERVFVMMQVIMIIGRIYKIEIFLGNNVVYNAAAFRQFVIMGVADKYRLPLIDLNIPAGFVTQAGRSFPIAMSLGAASTAEAAVIGSYERINIILLRKNFV